MCLGAAIRDAFWHRIGFRPDDVLAQIPAIGLEREGNAPWDADQVLRLQIDRLRWARHVVENILTFVLTGPATPCCATAAAIRVPEIEPQRAVLAQYAASLAEHFDHTGHVFGEGGFEAELPDNS